MPIKTFKVNDENKIEELVNKWEKDNKLKIDGITTCPIKWYMNNDLTMVTDTEILVTIVYHKRRIRKEIKNELL